MKTIYSLSEFKNQVKEIAESLKEGYYTVGVEDKSSSGLEFRCYIHNRGSFVGKTMEESIVKLRESVSTIVRHVDVDVEIEMPEEEIA